MSPYDFYLLSEEQNNSFEKLLAIQGIKVVPKSRSTTESLVDGQISSLAISGALLFENCEFSYQICHKHNRYKLRTNAFDADSKSAHALLSALERAFPDSGHEDLAKQVRQRKFDKGRIVVTLGCAVILLFIAGMLFLAAVGFWNMFLK